MARQTVMAQAAISTYKTISGRLVYSKTKIRSTLPEEFARWLPSKGLKGVLWLRIRVEKRMGKTTVLPFLWGIVEQRLTGQRSVVMPIISIIYEKSRFIFFQWKKNESWHFWQTCNGACSFVTHIMINVAFCCGYNLLWKVKYSVIWKHRGWVIAKNLQKPYVPFKKLGPRPIVI